MKYSKVALFLYGFIFFYSCTKDVGVPGITPPEEIFDSTTGKIQFMINGQPETRFKPSGQVIDGKLVIGGSKAEILDGGWVPFHYFSICLNNSVFDKQKLVKSNHNNPYSDSTLPWAFFGSMQDDGDVLCESFEVNEADSLTNFVQITKEQNNFSEIWGTFSVSFNKVDDCANGFYPNTIVIKRGYFHIFVK